MKRQSDHPEPRLVDHDAMRIVGLIGRYDQAMRPRIPAQWERLEERLQALGLPDRGERYGLVYPDDGDAGTFEYLTGISVAGGVPCPEGFTERTLAAHRHAVITHRGHVSGIARACEPVFREWLPASGYAPAGDPALLEVYGDDFDPVTLQGAVEIRIPLKRP